MRYLPPAALLAILLATPTLGQPVDEYGPRNMWYSTTSFYNLDEALNFIANLPYEKRDTARFFQLQAPGGWFHVVCRGCNPEWGKTREATNANTWWSPDPDAAPFFRKECEKEWANDRPCWYSEFKGETILVYFNDHFVPTRPKPY